MTTEGEHVCVWLEGASNRQFSHILRLRPIIIIIPFTLKYLVTVHPIKQKHIIHLTTPTPRLRENDPSTTPSSCFSRVYDLWRQSRKPGIPWLQQTFWPSSRLDSSQAVCAFVSDDRYSYTMGKWNSRDSAQVFVLQHITLSLGLQGRSPGGAATTRAAKASMRATENFMLTGGVEWWVRS